MFVHSFTYPPQSYFSMFTLDPLGEVGHFHINPFDLTVGVVICFKYRTFSYALFQENIAYYYTSISPSV